MIAVAFALPHCGLHRAVWRFMPKALFLPVGPIRYFTGLAMHQQIVPCHFPDNTLGATNILGTFGYLVAVIAAFVTIYIAAQMARGFFAQD